MIWKQEEMNSIWHHVCPKVMVPLVLLNKDQSFLMPLMDQRKSQYSVINKVYRQTIDLFLDNFTYSFSSFLFVSSNGAIFHLIYSPYWGLLQVFFTHAQTTKDKFLSFLDNRCYFNFFLECIYSQHYIV